MAGLVGVVFAGFAVQAAWRGPAPSEPTVAVVSSIQAPSVTPTAQSATPTETHREVALFPEKVLPEDLPKLSRQLWDKKVSHTYRDGQIYVAPEDREEALLALNTNEQRMFAHAELRAEKVDAKPSIPGFTDSSADNHYAPARPAAMAAPHSVSGGARLREPEVQADSRRPVGSKAGSSPAATSRRPWTRARGSNRIHA